MLQGGEGCRSVLLDLDLLMTLLPSAGEAGMPKFNIPETNPSDSHGIESSFALLAGGLRRAAHSVGRGSATVLFLST